MPSVREPDCIENWPECSEGEYNPSCCRFPKSCSVRDVPLTKTVKELLDELQAVCNDTSAWYVPGNKVIRILDSLYTYGVKKTDVAVHVERWRAVNDSRDEMYSSAFEDNCLTVLDIIYEW